MAREAEVVALCVVLRQRALVVLPALVGHEGVAEIDEEIGLRGDHVGERLLVDLRRDALIKVRVGLDDEGEWTTRRARRAKAPLVAALRLVAVLGPRDEAIGVVGVRGEAGQRETRGLACLHRDLRTHLALRGAGARKLDRTHSIARRAHADSHARRGRLHKDRLEVGRGHFGLERGHALEQTAVAFLRSLALRRSAVLLLAATATATTLALTFPATARRLRRTFRSRILQLDRRASERDRLHRVEQRLTRDACACLELRLGGKRVERRDVGLLARPLRARRRVLGAAIHIVLAEAPDRALSFGKRLRIGGNAVEHEIYALVAIGRDVVNREREALRFLRSIRPAEARHDRVAVAGVTRTKKPVVANAVAGHAEGRSRGRLAPRATAAAGCSPLPAGPRRVFLDPLLAIGADELEDRLAGVLDAVVDPRCASPDFVPKRPRLGASLLEARDLRATQLLQCRPHAVRARLRHHLRVGAASLDLDLATHAAVDVREGLRGVIVVRPRSAAEALALRHFAEVAVEFVERLVRTARTREIIALLRLRIEQAVDRETVERIRDRLALADDLLDRERRSVVVVVVAAAAVTAELVELADREAVDAPVVERIEDRDAVRRERHGASHERGAARDRLVRELRLQRNLPRVAAGVRLRQRHLLLPRGDADHHPHLKRRVRQAVRLDIEPAVVEARLHERRELVEDLGLRGLGRSGRLLDARVVDRADRRDARVGRGAVGAREIGEGDRLERARRRRDRDLAGASEEERALDQLARARIRPDAARRRIELVGRMRVRERRARERCDRCEQPKLHSPPPCCFCLRPPPFPRGFCAGGSPFVAPPSFASVAIGA